MSLRRDVHTAFDQITPSMGGLPERVVQTVLVEGATRRRREKMVFRFRAPLSLVAVLLLIALVAAVLIGGRLIQDWNALHRSSPAGSSSSELAQLEARPLNLPVFQSVSECTPGPMAPDNSAFGSGPVYAYAGSATTRSRQWEYYTVVLYTDEQISGPILLRVRDLTNTRNLVFVGKFTSGRAVGTDTLRGASVEQKTEVVLSESNPSTVVDDPPTKPHQFVWQIMVGVPGVGNLASSWQLDGKGFTEVFAVC